MRLIRMLSGTAEATCAHQPHQPVPPRGDACEECGSTWNLRACASCGHVGCCDSQTGDARRHYRRTGHEVMASMPVGSGFSWCYTDDRYVD